MENIGYKIDVAKVNIEDYFTFISPTAGGLRISLDIICIAIDD